MLADRRNSELTKKDVAATLGALRDGSDESVRALVAALSARGVLSDAAADALVQIGRPAVGALLSSMARPRDDVTGAAAIMALSKIEPVSNESVAAIVAALERTSPNRPSTLAAAADATSRLGPRGAPALPRLTALVRDPRDDVRLPAARAVAAQATDAANRGDVTRLGTLRSALVTIVGNRVGRDAPTFDADVVQPLREAIAALEHWLKLYVALGILALILVAVAATMAIWPLQRAVRLLIGQRWTFRTGHVDAVLVVEQIDTTVHVSFVGDAARSSVQRLSLRADAWPLSHETTARIRSSLGAGSLVRIEADRVQFARPWSHDVGGPWSKGVQAVFAGQLCVSWQALPSPPQFGRNLVFSGLRCENAAGIAATLPAAKSEIEGVGASFKRWGAHVRSLESDACVEDVRQALQNSDVVHISAHATTDQLFLADRPMTAADLDARLLQSMRCRILVLSACNAGDLDHDGALVWQLLNAGVNVLAALHRVRDAFCLMFFEELYDAMLPRRRAQGISLAAGIAAAVAACKRRLPPPPPLEVSLLPALEETIDSFIFYGDPSLNLRLARR
jgi:hypothetical protein